MYSVCMQMIVKTPCETVEEYIAQEMHLRIRAPERCPRCTKYHTLSHHGYYQRGCSDSEGKVLELSVRRFECSHCEVTVSCLPDFAQPYRMINNQTTEKFFNGEVDSRDVRGNRDNLRRYWRQFASHCDKFKGVVGSTFGLSPPDEPAAGLWRRIFAKYNSLASATLSLVTEFRITCFGQYRCHQPAMQVT